MPWIFQLQKFFLLHFVVRFSRPANKNALSALFQKSRSNILKYARKIMKAPVKKMTAGFFCVQQVTIKEPDGCQCFTCGSALPNWSHWTLSLEFLVVMRTQQERTMDQEPAMTSRRNYLSQKGDSNDDIYKRIFSFFLQFVIKISFK